MPPPSLSFPLPLPWNRKSVAQLEVKSAAPCLCRSSLCFLPFLFLRCPHEKEESLPRAGKLGVFDWGKPCCSHRWEVPQVLCYLHTVAQNYWHQKLFVKSSGDDTHFMSYCSVSKLAWFDIDLLRDNYAACDMGRLDWRRFPIGSNCIVCWSPHVLFSPSNNIKPFLATSTTTICIVCRLVCGRDMYCRSCVALHSG